MCIRSNQLMFSGYFLVAFEKSWHFSVFFSTEVLKNIYILYNNKNTSRSWEFVSDNIENYTNNHCISIVIIVEMDLGVRKKEIDSSDPFNKLG